MGKEVLKDFRLVVGNGDKLNTKPDLVIRNFLDDSGNITKFHSLISPWELSVKLFLYLVKVDLIKMIDGSF